MSERNSVPGPRSRALVDRAAELECPAFAYRRANRAGADPDDADPIVLASGEGATVADADGNRYVDLAAGFGSVLLGHGHPAIARAIAEQAPKLVQGLGDVYPSEVKIALLERLARLHPAGEGQVLLGQSGGDAVAAAMKTASLATGRHAFVAFDGAYHGLGYAPLAACGFKHSFRQPFAPQLNPRVAFAPYPGLRGASVEASLEMVRGHLRAEKVAAVLIEPVLGRGGCVVPPSGFLAELCRLAHHHGALVVADEIWTGLGRAGAMLRCAEEGAPVDIVCLGKGLGGGLSISACIATPAAMAGWARGETIHTSTHAGSPLACAAALATLDTVEQERLVPRARELGEKMRRRFSAELGDTVRDVRGAGLMIGVELEDAAAAQRAVRRLLRRGYLALTGGIDGATLTLTPPLTIGEAELAGFAPALLAP